jgi:hypothetical protein
MEKKHIVNDLVLSYDGPVSVEDYYKEIDDWIEEKGMQKEIKRKTEHVQSKGKKIEWLTEGWKEETHLVKSTVAIRTLFNNVREIRVKRRGKYIKTNQVEASIQIDGFIETKLNSQWTMNPLYLFFRTLFDKYIWNIGSTETERHQSKVEVLCYDLHKRLQSFFKLSKMKVQ